MNQVMEEHTGSAVEDKVYATVGGIAILGVVAFTSFLMFDGSATAATYAGIKAVVVGESVAVESPRLALEEGYSAMIADTLADTKASALKSSKTVYGELNSTIEMTLGKKTVTFEVYKKDSHLTLIGNGYGVIEGAKNRESAYSLSVFDGDAMKKWLHNKSPNDDMMFPFPLF